MKSWRIVYACPDCDNSCTQQINPGRTHDGTQASIAVFQTPHCTRCDHLPQMAMGTPELIEPKRIITPTLQPPPNIRRVN